MASPSRVGLVARTTSANGIAGVASLRDALQQWPDAQAVRADAVHRRDGSVEHVVATLEGARPFQGQDVERLLHDAEPRVVAIRVEADGAARAGGDVEADVAEHDLVPHGNQGRGQGARLSLGRPQQEVGQPLGGLGADAGQPRERLDEARDGLDDGHGSDGSGGGRDKRREVSPCRGS